MCYRADAAIRLLQGHLQTDRAHLFAQADIMVRRFQPGGPPCNMALRILLWHTDVF